jgi:deazaflavin-dependent oxidoreductase (nitroreductase family)
VLEVVSYDPATHESVVLSAYGEQADWYRNIQAHPAVEAQTGGSRYAPQFRLLSPNERYVALQTYQRRYRRAFRAVIRFLGYHYDGSDEGLRALADAVLMIAFRPQDASVDGTGASGANG